MSRRTTRSSGPYDTDNDDETDPGTDSENEEADPRNQPPTTVPLTSTKNRSYKLGTVVHDFDDPPLRLRWLIDSIPRSADPDERERHRRMHEQLKYAGRGKAYTRESRTMYFRNKPGFYVLEMPFTCVNATTQQPGCKGKERLGFKLGRAERNPTAADAVDASINSGGLLARLRSYWIEVGKNVRVRHLRVFQTEDLNYYGNRRRARLYERAIKHELNLRGVTPLRGEKGSEYHTRLDDIQRAMETHEQSQRGIGDITVEEMQNFQGRAVLDRRSERAVIKPGQKVVFFSSENPHPDGRAKTKKDRAYRRVFPAVGTILRLTAAADLSREEREQRYVSRFWDVKVGRKTQPVEMQFKEELYKRPNVEDGWVFLEDLEEDIPDGFGQALRKPPSPKPKPKPKPRTPPPFASAANTPARSPKPSPTARRVTRSRAAATPAKTAKTPTKTLVKTLVKTPATPIEVKRLRPANNPGRREAPLARTTK